MNRSLVNKALEKAAQAEADGDEKRAAYWMDFAERAEKAYDNREKTTDAELY